LKLRRSDGDSFQAQPTDGAMSGMVHAKTVNPATKLDVYLIAEEDIPYEEELIRNPYTLQPWLRYLQHKTDRPLHEKVFVLERACRELPGSYKLWKMYLELRLMHLEGLNPAKYEDEYNKVNDAFERALVLLNKVSLPRSKLT
jgi:pre-mRNA-splicing factor SYF1